MFSLKLTPASARKRSGTQTRANRHVGRNLMALGTWLTRNEKNSVISHTLLRDNSVYLSDYFWWNVFLQKI